MTKLIINTISSAKIDSDAPMGKGNWVFTAGYLDRKDRVWNTWESRSVRNPTEGDMATQAQRFLSEDIESVPHPYLEGYKVNENSHTISMEFGS